ncbi:MAG: hypothetical protein JNJ61_27155 [Anaerolineae bacterium]|nr:hypothetical protein [Anaerolineae bacterium]
MITVHRAHDDLLDQVRFHCQAYHYLHSWPDPRSLPFAYYAEIDGRTHAEDGRLLGLVVMKKPQHHQHHGLFGYPKLPTAWQVLDLARVWVHPSLQFQRVNGHSLCIFSQMVGKVLRRVQWDWLEHHPPRYPDRSYHIELIISYCEIAHHTGKAYRASGFTQHGFSRDMSMEVYIRRLRPPQQRWTPKRLPARVEAQMPLFADVPILYRECEA